MSLRETINRAPVIPIVIVAILVVACGWIVYRSVGSDAPPSVGTSFYTIDDGKTYFADSRSSYPVFQKDGKDALYAGVYTCDGGKTTFVGFLRKVEAPKTPTGMQVAVSVKRPGESKWIPLMSREARAVTTISCPGGSPDKAQEVKP